MCVSALAPRICSYPSNKVVSNLDHKLNRWRSILIYWSQASRLMRPMECQVNYSIICYLFILFCAVSIIYACINLIVLSSLIFLLGSDCQILTIQLQPGSSVQSEAGAMMFMSPDVKTTSECGGFGRCCCAGESCCKIVYTNRGNTNG